MKTHFPEQITSWNHHRTAAVSEGPAAASADAQCRRMIPKRVASPCRCGWCSAHSRAPFPRAFGGGSKMRPPARHRGFMSLFSWCVPASLHQVAAERPEAGKLIAFIHVMFDHVEREVIEPAETPDSDGQQNGDFQRGLFQHEQGRCD